MGKEKIVCRTSAKLTGKYLGYEIDVQQMAMPPSLFKNVVLYSLYIASGILVRELILGHSILEAGVQIFIQKKSVIFSETAYDM